MFEVNHCRMNADRKVKVVHMASVQIIMLVRYTLYKTSSENENKQQWI